MFDCVLIIAKDKFLLYATVVNLNKNLFFF